MHLSPDEKRKPRNKKAFHLFDNQYDTIVTILSQNEALQTPFASKLVEVGLIGTAERDQAMKIEELIVRLKAIIGAVSTMIQRGVRPDDLMNRFVSVIVLPKWQNVFTDVIMFLEGRGDMTIIHVIIILALIF